MPTKEEYELMLRMERDSILAKGAETSDGRFWFNESLAKVFILKATAVDLTSRLLENPTFKWKDNKGDIVDVSIKEAKVYIKEIIAALDEVYLDKHLAV